MLSLSHSRPLPSKFNPFNFHSPFTLHTSQHTAAPSNHPINSRPLPLPLPSASSSAVNKLRLFLDDHSSNLERNRRACEVAKLLPLPNLLQSIAFIKADYITQVDERTQNLERKLESLSLSQILRRRSIANSMSSFFFLLFFRTGRLEFGTANKSLYSKLAF
ncbi:hypothetical protein NC652_030258 [Populus alba x Populus x berolinensis]|nr:hypothetical protein NC652_030258 [Populus alba x Populus x berolinensis]